MAIPLVSGMRWLLMVGMMMLAGVQPHAHDNQLTIIKIVSAFKVTGLPVDNLHQEALYGTPSGPPMTEKEAWRFSIPEVAPSGGKIMLFSSNERRDRKANWFRMVGTSVLVHKNVILWLDPGLSAQRIDSYYVVLKNL